jgi:acyl-CoA synthetase (AMP-forming)/AMP-acid ligase II
VLNPLNVRLVAREQAEVLRDCGSRHLVADVGFAPLVAQILEQGTAIEGRDVDRRLGADRAARVRVRSRAGRFPRATRRGAPGGRCARAPLLHERHDRPREGRRADARNVATHALATIGELSLSERDTWAHVAPMFHLADAWATFAITWAGGRHATLARFEARAALDLLERERVTITNLIPTMLNLMVRDPSAAGRDWSALRMLLSGGAPIAPEVVRAIVDVFGCEYVQTYGMTETSPYLTLSLLKEHLKRLPLDEQMRYRAKTGRPFATIELRVVGEDGRDVAPDERTVGEIRVRGETVTPGYWKPPGRDRRRVPRRVAVHRRPGRRRRRGLRDDRRPREGHDHHGRREGVLDRGRARALRAPGRARGGGVRHARTPCGASACAPRSCCAAGRPRASRSSLRTAARASQPTRRRARSSS